MSDTVNSINRAQNSINQADYIRDMLQNYEQSKKSKQTKKATDNDTPKRFFNKGDISFKSPVGKTTGQAAGSSAGAETSAAAAEAGSTATGAGASATGTAAAGTAAAASTSIWPFIAIGVAVIFIMLMLCYLWQNPSTIVDCYINDLKMEAQAKIDSVKDTLSGSEIGQAVLNVASAISDFFSTIAKDLTAFWEEITGTREESLPEDADAVSLTYYKQMRRNKQALTKFLNRCYDQAIDEAKAIYEANECAGYSLPSFEDVYGKVNYGDLLAVINIGLFGFDEDGQKIQFSEKIFRDFLTDSYNYQFFYILNVTGSGKFINVEIKQFTLNTLYECFGLTPSLSSAEFGTANITLSDGAQTQIQTALNQAGKNRTLIQTAVSLIGKVPYQWGGKSSMSGYDDTWWSYLSNGDRKGLDCSGYVQWCFRTAGYDKNVWSNLGSTSAILKYAKQINESQLKIGDLGLLNDGSSTNHVGIYLGNGYYIHCASGAGTVIVNQFDFKLFYRVEATTSLVYDENTQIVPSADNNTSSQDSSNGMSMYNGDITVEDQREDEVNMILAMLEGYDLDFGLENVTPVSGPLDADTITDITVEAGSMSTSANAKTVYNILKNEGFTDAGIAGIMGNLQVEHSFSTSWSGDQGSVGIAQWRGGRKDKLVEFAKKRNASPTDITVQAEFLIYELRNSYSTVYNACKNQSYDYIYCADIFCQKFEGCANYDNYNDYINTGTYCPGGSAYYINWNRFVYSPVDGRYWLDLKRRRSSAKAFWQAIQDNYYGDH